MLFYLGPLVYLLSKTEIVRLYNILTYERNWLKVIYS